jgi:hypothetical protein
METIEDQILGFIARQRRTPRARVVLSSELVQDLGIDGDDAIEFFNLFGEMFKVDLDSLWLHWDQHFSPEGFFHNSTFPSMATAVTVQDLAAAARAGNWIKSYRGSTNTLTRDLT